jgi:hypothetical protein
MSVVATAFASFNVRKEGVAVAIGAALPPGRNLIA